MNPNRPKQFRNLAVLAAATVLATALHPGAAFGQEVRNGVLRYPGQLGTTPAGTVISNSAYADYEDVAGNAATRVVSNVVRTTVSSVYGTFVNPPAASKSGNAGESSSFAFTVINVGNTTDTMTLAPTGTPPTGWTVSIVVDTNGDGVRDPGETQAASTTGPLEPGAHASFHLVADVPASAADGSSGTLEVTSTTTGDASKTAKGVYNLNIAAGVANVIKRIVQTTSFKPGDLVTYEIGTENTGSATITGASLIDRIPAGTLYVPNSMRYGPRGTAYGSATPLTDSATDGDFADFNVTNPNAISIGPRDLQPGQVANSLFFRVRIRVIAAGSVVSNVAVESHEGSEEESNAATFTVGAGSRPVIAPAQQSKFAEPGQQVIYFLTVANIGNVDDFINLSFQSPTGFPWVFHAAGGNPLVPGTPLVDNNNDGFVDVGSVPPGATRAIALVGTVPGGMLDAAVDATVVTAAMVVLRDAEANTSTLTTTIQAPRITLVKSVSPTGPAPPGAVLTYSTRVSNDGSGNAYNVVIRDNIPQFTTYVANSMRASVNDGPYAPLTDAAGDDGARFDDVANALITTPVTMGPHTHAVFEFKVRIN
jgi:uncharacterized repeat protein (TIGR01451 family)